MSSSEIEQSKKDVPLSGKDALVGKQLGNGRYTLVKVLATGGMARIYEAVDHRLEITIAIKVLLANTSGSESEDDTLTERFKREAQAIGRLQETIKHPNIITVYSYDQEDGLHYIAMSLVRGKDLAQVLGRMRREGSKMLLPRIIHIIEQVASALDAAHQAGIIHRDIKPSNILVDQNDHVTLTDFGLLLRPSTDSTFGTAFGTPRYISPEQAIASSQVTPQSDIYSLAIILYEMLTGRTPFNGDTPMEIALAHIHDEPPSLQEFNPSIPDAVEAEVLRALSKDPKLRHVSARQFVGAIKRAYGMQHDDTPLISLDALNAASKPNRPEDWTARIAANRATAEARTAGSPVPAVDYSIAPPAKPVSVAAKPAPISPSARSRRTSPILLIVLALLFALVVGAAWLMRQPDSSNSPFMVAVTDEPTPESVPVELVYDQSSFTLVNLGTVALQPSRITFVASDRSVYAAIDISPTQIEPGYCIRIRVQDQSVDPPRACNSAMPEALIPSNRAPSMFWRAIEAGVNFTVNIDSSTVMTCPTIRRGESETCSLQIAP